VPLVDTFSATDTPQSRIHIVRSKWNNDMESTRIRLAKLRARARRAPAPPHGEGARGGWRVRRVGVITGAGFGSRMRRKTR
jgi:hypothetical protein